MKALRRHPFPVVAWFDRVIALSFAFPEDMLAAMLPDGLEVDSYEGHGFLTVALVWARNLRPAGFPEFLGNDFFLTGYRIFVRMRGDDGRRLRGLKILRSETDQVRMMRLGNLLTHYDYRQIHLDSSCENKVLTLKTTRKDGAVSLEAVIDLAAEPTEVPEGSPFPDWRTARRFAGPMPFTFDDEGDGRFVVIEGKRSEWTPRPVEVHSWKVGLFDEPSFGGFQPVLANAFLVEGVPYRWERGRLMNAGKEPKR